MPLRIAYPVTASFSKRVTLLVISWVVAAILGLFAFNWFSQAKYQSCTSYSNTTWTGSNCANATLKLMETYYTRSASDEMTDMTVGNFPWQLQGFGQSNSVPIDSTILSVNWTGDVLECSLIQEVLTVHLDTGASTTAASYYCGVPLRVLSTVVDTERTSLTNASAAALSEVISSYSSIAEAARSLGTWTNAAISSVSIIRQATVPTLPTDLQFFQTNATEVFLGTTLGPVSVTQNTSIPAVNRIATLGSALADQVESATLHDLSGGRTLLVTYICQQCRRKYKNAWEIFAIILASVSAVLGPAYAIGVFLAEMIFVKPHETAMALEELQQRARRSAIDDDASKISRGDSFANLAYGSGNAPRYQGLSVD